MPKGASRRQKERAGAPGTPPRRQNGRQVAPGSANIKFFLRGLFAKRRRADFPSILVDFLLFRKVRECSEVPCLPVKTRVRPFAL